MSPEEELWIQQRCAQLIHEFGAFVDADVPTRVAELFTADGVLDRAGIVATGRAAIASSISRAAPGTVRVHLYSNLTVRVQSSDHAAGRCYYQAFTFDAAPDEQQPTTPMVLGRIEDTFVRTEQGWRISYRRQVRVATRGRAPSPHTGPTPERSS
ncbi:nuclear transport factor 2 family protein [Streptomyces sp. NBC_00988]|uniref:nuclear transport factor 2 family protein n=1 Tax=Streptomyces sp. NBC_00988 TaxID=2903704 RepID=UPI00386E375A|nr:nuclear transport factor 2 family protein [Streptomyces sp. NBC_00988]